jgi:tetratricopeptide (TPR) repeat protein
LNSERDEVRAPEIARTARHADGSKSHSVERAQSTVEARPVTGRQWAKLVASGEFRQVTREADSMGLMVCLAKCSATDLRALADASRYIGRLDTAEAALRALHDNHPAQSTTAAYLLGVVDESRGRNASALRWYNEYLSGASGGSFSSEAKAARLRMLVATGDKVAARRAATEYLERYPSGSAAGLSRRVLEGR